MPDSTHLQEEVIQRFPTPDLLARIAAAGEINDKASWEYRQKEILRFLNSIGYENGLFH